MAIDAYLLNGRSYRELEKKYGVSRPAINRWVLDYQGIARSRAIYVKEVIQQILKHRELQPKIGTRKLIVMMQDFAKEHHINLGRDALFDSLRANNLLIKKQKRKVQTTFSNH